MIILVIFGHEWSVLVFAFVLVDTSGSSQSWARSLLFEIGSEAIYACSAGKKLKRICKTDKKNNTEAAESNEKRGRGVPIDTSIIAREQSGMQTWL